MFKTSKVLPAYKNLIGWRQFHDDTIIILPPELTTTDSGEFYQQKHPALQLDIIQTLIPSEMELAGYLKEVVDDSINEIFNDLLQYRQISEYGKTLLEQSVLLNRYGWSEDKITNQGRFVGFQVRTRSITGLQTVINEIGLQFSGVEAFDLYLFHSSKVEPLQVLPVAPTGGNGWKWIAANMELSAFESTEYQGGFFVLGYY